MGGGGGGGGGGGWVVGWVGGWVGCVFFNDTATTEIYTKIARRQRQMCIRDRETQLEEMEQEGVELSAEDLADIVYNLGLEQAGDDALLEPNRAWGCLLYTSPSPRDRTRSRMPSSA